MSEGGYIFPYDFNKFSINACFEKIEFILDIRL